jgi:putative salt-induced outer membrane protein
MQKSLITAALVLALSPIAAFAADDSWSGTGELGLAIAKGNSDNQTLNGKLGLAKDSDKWKHAFGAAFLYGKSDDIESARRYEIFGTTGYRLTDRSYLFGSARNERDRFAGAEYQWTAAGGYGYEAIKNDSTKLTLEIGPGYRWSKVQGLRIHNNEAIARGFMDFGHKFNDSTSIYDTLLIESGSDNTFARNDLGVLVKMTDAMALKAGVEVRHNTDVPVGVKKTDTLSTVSLVYGF